MKISDEYLLRSVLNEYALIPVGGAIDRGGHVLKLNKSGYIIVNALLEEISYEDLMSRLIDEFEVEEEIEKFEEYVNIFVETLKTKKILTIL